MSKEKSDRQQRLAQALRDNLRRRKGQARTWTQETKPEQTPGDMNEPAGE